MLVKKYQIYRFSKTQNFFQFFGSISIHCDSTIKTQACYSESVQKR